MNIPIPQWLINLWIAFGDYANVWVWQSKTGRLEVRRVDILVVILFMFCTAYYWVLYGWQGAVQGAAAYIFLGMIGLWFFPR